MNSYYFKIDTAVGIRYCCFNASSYEQAKRNALFACFSEVENECGDIPFHKRCKTPAERFYVLNEKYSVRIEDTTKETYEEEDSKQTD